jgi:hypothetical protein
MRIAAGIARLVTGAAIPIATGAATWIDPAPVTEPPVRQHQVSAVPKANSAAPGAQIGLPAQPGDKAPAVSGIRVAQWEFSPVALGRPVYLSMTLDGTQAAIDRMRANRPATIQVRWTRDAANGAPDLVTELTVGQPSLPAALAGEVQRRGYFEWHSWARKDTLSPGTWTVSLTYSDGTPLPCGQQAQPCRFTINVG